MAYTIKLLPLVYTDLQEAKKWYNEQREALGEEFKEEVNKEIDYIGQHPEHYQRKYKELRQSLGYSFSLRCLLSGGRKEKAGYRFWTFAHTPKP